MDQCDDLEYTIIQLPDVQILNDNMTENSLSNNVWNVQIKLYSFITW